MKNDNSESQAEAQLASIVEMVDRLNHIQEGGCSYEDYLENPESTCDGVSFDSEEDYDRYHNEDSAREDIINNALCVDVRSGWCSSPEMMKAEEFNILLCTGGPAVRIIGELDNGSPYNAQIQHQDWGTPWTDYYAGDDAEALQTFCENFYFGE